MRVFLVMALFWFIFIDKYSSILYLEKKYGRGILERINTIILEVDFWYPPGMKAKNFWKYIRGNSENPGGWTHRQTGIPEVNAELCPWTGPKGKGDISW